eukprot:gnl/MRDRNA2_/MRDRNA2_76596_c0_seq1.p1 gnl/MRDRNA2_/MRDRNA2_76596_c0~~gnl/MRDRNA2_/MRDRNA2_76596_c0_seq1.p1  ORF type:complete len:912 (+),score=154.65 gnl/MRDRNA2_/MRDRNA2_76596_c0_seq1:99-2834(+)
MTASAPFRRPASAPSKRPGSAHAAVRPQAPSGLQSPPAQRPESAPVNRSAASSTPRTLCVQRPQSAPLTRPVAPSTPRPAPVLGRGSNKSRFFEFFEPPRQAAVAAAQRRPTSARTIVAAHNAPVRSSELNSMPQFLDHTSTPPPPPPVREPVRPPSPERPILSVRSPQHVVERVLWAMHQHSQECAQASADWVQRAHLRRTPSAPRRRSKSAPPVVKDGAFDSRDSKTPASASRRMRITEFRFGAMRRSLSTPNVDGKKSKKPASSPAGSSKLQMSGNIDNTTIKLELPIGKVASPASHENTPRMASKSKSDEQKRRAKEAARRERQNKSIYRIMTDEPQDSSRRLTSLSDTASSTVSKPFSRSRVSAYIGQKSPGYGDLFSVKADRVGQRGQEPERRNAFKGMTNSTKTKFFEKHQAKETNKTNGEQVEFRVICASSEGGNRSTDAASNLATTIDGQPFGWQAASPDEQWVILDVQTSLTVTAITLMLEGGETNPVTCAVQFAVEPPKHDQSDAWTTACSFEIGEEERTVSRSIDYEGVMQVSRFKSMLIKRYGSINRAWRRILDTSGDGQLSYEEFLAACKEIGYKPPKGISLDSLYLELDGNRDGVVRASDLTNAKSTTPRTRYWRLLFGHPHGHSHSSQGPSAIKICSPLRIFSTDILPVPRKEARAKALSNYLSQTMAAKVNAFNDLGDVVLDDEELEIRDLAKKHGIQILQVEKMKKQFDGFDGNASGAISFDEFKGLMIALMQAKEESDVPPRRIEFFWQMVDADQSGTVEFEEFLTWSMAYFDMFDNSYTVPHSELAERFIAHAQECRVMQAREWAEQHPLRNRLGAFAVSKIREDDFTEYPPSTDSSSSEADKTITVNKIEQHSHLEPESPGATKSSPVTSGMRRALKSKVTYHSNSNPLG